MNDKKKIIVDFKKLNSNVLDLLVDTYPDGYDDDDIITYRNSLGEIVECVRVSSDDTIYLVKVSKRLLNAMEDHSSEDENEDRDEEEELEESENTLDRHIIEEMENDIDDETEDY